MTLKENEFYDINKFPKDPGITVLGISMPSISLKQNPRACIDATKHLISKVLTSNVGANIIYTDSLYLFSDKSATSLKTKFQKLVCEHKQGYLNLIKKDLTMIPKAFTFTTWSQLILDTPLFPEYSKQFREFYDNDPQYKKIVHDDIIRTGREISKNYINYILEEDMLDYLLAKGLIRLQNDYVNDKEKWILNCYHGKPRLSSIYVHQNNVFNLTNSENCYENSFYDVEGKILYEYDRVNLETISL